MKKIIKNVLLAFFIPWAFCLLWILAMVPVAMFIFDDELPIHHTPSLEEQYTKEYIKENGIDLVNKSYLEEKVYVGMPVSELISVIGEPLHINELEHIYGKELYEGQKYKSYFYAVKSSIPGSIMYFTIAVEDEKVYGIQRSLGRRY